MSKNVFDEKEVQMIVFSIGEEEYAVSITEVQEIIMPQDPTRIPKSPKFVEGVINLRGNIIPVIDGRKKFGLETATIDNKTRIMVLEANGETVGLIVDSVSEVIHLQTAHIEAPPKEFSDNANYLLGIGKVGNRLIILLKLDKFLSLNEYQELKSLDTNKLSKQKT